MASAKSIDDLLLDPAFNGSVKAVYAALVRAQLGHGTELNINLALDAMSFVAAMFQEALPDYIGDAGLVQAAQNLHDDQGSFLRFMRDHSEETGKHMLEGVAKHERDEAEATDDGPSEDKTSSEIEELVVGFQRVMMAKSPDADRTLDERGREGAYLAYDLSTIMYALTWVIGSMGFQSGAAATPKTRRQFADAAREAIIKAMKNAEKALEGQGQLKPLH